MDVTSENATHLLRPRTVFLRFARSTAALVGGVAITFTQDHSNAVGVLWLVGIACVSLAVIDGPRTLANRATWWISVVVVVFTVIGFLNANLSAPGSLSLMISVAAFETTRALVRRDIVWAVSTGVLVVALSVVYFTTSSDSPVPSGLVGAWAIVTGVFSTIAGIDSLIRLSRQHTTPAKSAASSTKRVSSAPRERITHTTPTTSETRKATTNGTK